MTLAALAYEALVCLLLAAAVVMCWRVDRRLRALRSGQDGLKDTITDLNDAVDRARASLAALDRASKEQGAALKSDVDAARRLSDELRFLTDQGEDPGAVGAGPPRAFCSAAADPPGRRSAPMKSRLLGCVKGAALTLWVRVRFFSSPCCWAACWL
jgi:hypothetical protein